MTFLKISKEISNEKSVTAPVWETAGPNNLSPCSSGWSCPLLCIARIRRGWPLVTPRPWSPPPVVCVCVWEKKKKGLLPRAHRIATQELKRWTPTSHLILKEMSVLKKNMTQMTGHTTSPSQKIRDSESPDCCFPVLWSRGGGPNANVHEQDGGYWHTHNWRTEHSPLCSVNVNCTARK